MVRNDVIPEKLYELLYEIIDEEVKKDKIVWPTHHPVYNPPCEKKDDISHR